MGLFGVSVDAVALVAATAKSVFEIGSPSTMDGEIAKWWVEFDGVTATAVPVKVEIGRFSSAVTTATAVTPFKYRGTAGPVSAMTVKHSTTVEGAGTASDVQIHRIPPTSGYVEYEPLGSEFYVPPSTFYRIRITAAAAVNVSLGVVWRE